MRKNKKHSKNCKAMQHRSQLYNPKIQRWIKRNTKTGEFMNVKDDAQPFKRVIEE